MFSLRRFTWFVVFLLLMFLAFSNAVYAQGPDGVIPTGTNLDGDAFLAAPDVIVDGNVNGDVFAVGQNVTVNGNVTGSLFLVAEQATIRGNVNGNIYTAAANLTLDETAQIQHTAYVSAVSLMTLNGSTIARDLFIVSDCSLRPRAGRE